jgi:hypothetical protein
VKLDRDWYTGAEEGGLAGDEESNPLAQYEDLFSIKQAEISHKQVVRNSVLLSFSLPAKLYYRRKYRPNKRNMYVYKTTASMHIPTSR